MTSKSAKPKGSPRPSSCSSSDKSGSASPTSRAVLRSSPASVPHASGCDQAPACDPAASEQLSKSGGAGRPQLAAECGGHGGCVSGGGCVHEPPFGTGRAWLSVGSASLSHASDAPSPPLHAAAPGAVDVHKLAGVLPELCSDESAPSADASAARRSLPAVPRACSAHPAAPAVRTSPPRRRRRPTAE